ncbi:NAD(P)-binding protein [Colletotrichum scovillei]|uniref:NAD(P)-binding protein n=1 Tax=Colletotrichum scovillei TaxID=1209932 RepID=A0A9P7UEP2_9PEZI|nr:NAD(P)-binding protein [Colletotrichum scovillei]KAG7071357.1 NAD(P)-binding protein [Colletotrichum scovillei]KAG7079637.1 NAD(P)-binding protein [Colletotrichum scovillei]
MGSLDITRLFSVKGHVAVVTGGSSGLGLMIAKGLVTNGAKVYVVALPTGPIAEAVKELNELGESSGGNATGVPCDLSSHDEITKLVKYVQAREHSLDLLVSNAGIRRDPLDLCDLETVNVLELQASMQSSRPTDWKDTFSINVTAHYYLAVAFLPLLHAAASHNGDDGSGSRQGRGAMIMTSSCASMHNVTNVDLTSYAASKAATDHLVKLLAAKFRNFYVRVVGLNPGFFPSRMNPVGEEGNVFNSLFDKVPAKRAGQDEDIAGAVIYLASRAGSYVDGINLCIDGGRILVANGQE